MCFNDLQGSEYNEVESERMILRQIHSVSVVPDGALAEMDSPTLLFRRKSSESRVDRHAECLFLPPEHDPISCSICLEEVAPQCLSLLCGHYFHTSCLEQWEEGRCPLCRYHQQPPLISFCAECSACEGLWVCLICGVRLCMGGQGDILDTDSHIYQHFQVSGHALSMGVESRLIFDARVPAMLHQMFYRELGVR